MEGSWGVCGAMVCSWIKAVRSGATVTSASDIGPTGSMILGQHHVMRAPNADSGKARLFRLYGLDLRNRFGFFAAGNRALFTPRRLAEAPLAPDFSTSRSLGGTRPPTSRGSTRWALGPRQANRWQLCDPNFFLWEFGTQAEFVTALESLLGGNGVPPDVASGPYPVLSGSIYYLT